MEAEVAIVSAKNQALSPMSGDLGFGAGELQRQLADAEAEERKRRALGIGARSQAGSVLSRATPLLSPGTLSLFGVSGYGR
jgi:hypothetical protein